MLFLTQVTEWRDTRDSSNRIAPIDGNHRDFILNTNRISEIVDIGTVPLPKSRFFYSDNPNDRREGLSTVECNLSPASLITLFDTSPHSKAVTLRIHKHNNPDHETIDTTIAVESITYVDRYNPDPDHHVWVCYYKGAFKRMEVLCNHGIQEFVDIIESGSTSST